MSSLSGSEIITGNTDRAWLLTYFPAAWLGHVCQVSHVSSDESYDHDDHVCTQGLAMGILGPTQPYLALMVAVPVARFVFQCQNLEHIDIFIIIIYFKFNYNEIDE